MRKNYFFLPWSPKAVARHVLVNNHTPANIAGCGTYGIAEVATQHRVVNGETVMQISLTTDHADAAERCLHGPGVLDRLDPALPTVGICLLDRPMDVSLAAGVSRVECGGTCRGSVFSLPAGIRPHFHIVKSKPKQKLVLAGWTIQASGKCAYLTVPADTALEALDWPIDEASVCRWKQLEANVAELKRRLGTDQFIEVCDVDSGCGEFVLTPQQGEELRLAARSAANGAQNQRLTTSSVPLLNSSNPWALVEHAPRNGGAAANTRLVLYVFANIARL